MNKTIENVSWSGWLCPLDGRPKLFSTCLQCTKGVCEIPILRAMGKPFPVIENEYHVTEVIGPPKIMKFKRENPYYMEPDNATFMFIGTAVHEKIEIEAVHYWDNIFGHPCYEQQHEVKFRYDLDPYTIVGTMDYIDRDKKLIQDWKCLGSWKTRQLLDKALNGTLIHDEYGLQLNGYRAWGFPEAETLRLYCIIRDYNGRNAGMYKLDSQQMKINVPIIAGESAMSNPPGQRDSVCPPMATDPLGSDLASRLSPAQYMDTLARNNIEESLKDEPRMCTHEERWPNKRGNKYMRCDSFCPNRLCEHYGGVKYNPSEVT